MSAKKTTDKKALKELREERRVWVARAKQSIQTQNEILRKIKTQMTEGSKTIPEIAQATGMPAAQVLLYVAGLKKYGLVVEADKDGDYFKYALVS